jgi:hypothetical protein
MYEVYKIEDDGSKTLVNTTDIDMGAVGVVYDILNSKATETLDRYVDDGSIQSEDKAMMIANVINNVTNQAMGSLKLNKDLDVLTAQKELYIRQKEGFDDNKYQNLFKDQLHAWALMYSSGLLTDKPAIISSDELSALYNILKPIVEAQG